MVEGLILYKLIILYMLDRTDDNILSYDLISDFILKHGYTTLFNILEVLGELVDKGFISVSTIREVKHYKITDMGEETLFYFENRLPNSIKQDILTFFKEERINLRNQTEHTADYYFNENQEYTVECILKERKDTLVNLKLSVPSKGLAAAICDNWNNKSMEVYSFLVNELFTSQSSDSEMKEKDS